MPTSLNITHKELAWQRRRVILQYLIAVLTSVGAVTLVYFSGGHILVLPVLAAGACFAVLLFRLPELGIYTLLAVVMVMEQFKLFLSINRLLGSPRFMTT
ncbi:MAG: hypothetical protein K9M45_10245 [Kiritimatiellales bacterium]|nr:hypothetical protein [Kiritimatiellales bacterium]